MGDGEVRWFRSVVGGDRDGDGGDRRAVNVRASSITIINPDGLLVALFAKRYLGSVLSGLRWSLYVTLFLSPFFAVLRISILFSTSHSHSKLLKRMADTLLHRHLYYYCCKMDLHPLPPRCLGTSDLCPLFFRSLLAKNRIET